MIFGDPHRFAILIQHIPEWGNDSFKNGVFHFCIDGFFFPEEIRTSTLWVDVLSLDESNPLISHKEDENLFKMNASDAFNVMLGMISPELIGLEEPDDFEQSYAYQASTENINDFGYAVFAVCNTDKIRILGAKHSELRENENGTNQWGRITTPNIKEATISKEEIIKIISGVLNYQSQLK